MTIEDLNVTLADYENTNREILEKINELIQSYNFICEQQTKINEHFSERLDRYKRCFDALINGEYK